MNANTTVHNPRLRVRGSAAQKHSVLVTFSVAVLAHHNKGSLEKKVRLGLQFQRVRAHGGGAKPRWKEKEAADSQVDPQARAERTNEQRTRLSTLTSSDTFSTRAYILTLSKQRSQVGAETKGEHLIKPAQSG